MAARSTEARVSILEDRVQGQGAEIQRMRERLHLMEGDRSAIRLAVSALRDLRRDVPKLAEQAAVAAVALALHERDQAHVKQDERRRVNFRDLALLLFAALAVASFLFDHF